MIKKLPKILIIFFLIIFILQLFSLVFLVFYPRASQAAELGQNCQNDSDCVENLECRDNLCTMIVTAQNDDDIKFKPQVDIPGYIVVQPDGSTAAIGEYIKAIYKYAIGVVGILAAVVLMFGGVLWLTAGGNTERISNAKSWIGASITGLILAFLSYAILATINPALVNFKITGVDETPDISQGCCQYTASCNDKIKSAECTTAKPPLNIKGEWLENNICVKNKCEIAKGCGADINISCGGSCEKFIAANSGPCSDASPALTEFLKNYNPKLNISPLITGISDSAGLVKCRDHYDKSVCHHTQGSCHYGCGKYDGSYAIDFTCQGICYVKMEEEAKKTIHFSKVFCENNNGNIINCSEPLVDHIHIQVK